MKVRNMRILHMKICNEKGNQTSNKVNVTQNAEGPWAPELNQVQCTLVQCFLL